MGTALLMANINSQTLNIRAIVGAFVVIVIILAFYNLFKGNNAVKTVAFLTICGVIVISSLIILTSAVEALINVYGDKI